MGRPCNGIVARGFTQAEWAEHAQISVRAVSDLERGLKHPQRATIRLLTEALGLLSDEARDFEALGGVKKQSPVFVDLFRDKGCGE